MTVSHETQTATTSRRVSRGTLAALAMLLVAGLAVACGRPAGPRGWAAPEPVDADSVTIVPHKKTLYAIQKDTAQTELVWQFPPRDREQYALSEAAADELAGLVDGMGLDGPFSRRLVGLIRGTNVGGPTVEALKDGVEEVAAESGQLEASERSAFLSRVDEIVAEERASLRGVRAFYGDLGVSADGDTAYATSYGGWLFALDVETGATRWIVELDPMVAGVLVDSEQVYVGTKEGGVFALNAENGSILSDREVDGEVWGTPASVSEGDGIFVPTLDGSLYRLSDTLDVVWTFEADGALAQSPVVDSDRVYIGGFDSTLYAISADTGNAVWSIEADNWFWGTPVVDGGTLYAPSLDGKVYAVDAQTGDARWPRPFNTDDQVRSGLVVSGDILVVGSRDGYVHRVSLDDGTEIGDPLQIATRLEADLAVDEEGNVYAVPRTAKLSVIDVTGSILSETRYDLPD